MRKTAVFVVKNILKMLHSSIKGLTKIIKDILCNIVKFKSAIRKNRTFLRKQNSSKYSVGYKRNFFIKLMTLGCISPLLTDSSRNRALYSQKTRKKGLLFGRWMRCIKGRSLAAALSVSQGVLSPRFLPFSGFAFLCLT